eukprot:g590.t1
MKTSFSSLLLVGLLVILSKAAGTAEYVERAIVARARELVRGGRPRPALEMIQGLEGGQQTFPLLMYGGMAATAVGNLSTAIEFFERAVALKPDSAAAVQNLAVARHDRGFPSDWVAAMQGYRAAFERRLLDAMPTPNTECAAWTVHTDWELAAPLLKKNKLVVRRCKQDQEHVLVTVQGAQLADDSGTVVLPDDCVAILNSHGPLGGVSKYVFAERRENIEYLDAAGSIMQTSLSNYYHLMVEGVPKLLMLAQELDGTLPIIVPDNALFNKTFEMIRHLMMPERRLIYYRPRQHPLRVRTLSIMDRTVVASVDEMYTATKDAITFYWKQPPMAKSPVSVYFPTHSAIMLLRKALPCLTKTGGHVVFVSRRDARVRAMDSEESFLALLENMLHDVLGLKLKVLVGTLMPIAEQKKLVCEAKAIIGGHGAGLTNIIFASSGTPFIFFPAHGDLYDGGGYYGHLARLVGLRYVPMRDFAIARTGNFTIDNLELASRQIVEALSQEFAHDSCAAA